MPRIRKEEGFLEAPEPRSCLGVTRFLSKRAVSVVSVCADAALYAKPIPDTLSRKLCSRFCFPGAQGLGKLHQRQPSSKVSRLLKYLHTSSSGDKTWMFSDAQPMVTSVSFCILSGIALVPRSWSTPTMTTHCSWTQSFT